MVFYRSGKKRESKKVIKGNMTLQNYYKPN